MRDFIQLGFKIGTLATALGVMFVPTVALSQNSPSVANPTTTPVQTSTGTYVGAAQPPASTIIQNTRKCAADPYGIVKARGITASKTG